MTKVKLTETVTVEREVPSHIADLVLFASYLREEWLAAVPSGDDLIKAARDFWDTQHGEE